MKKKIIGLCGVKSSGKDTTFQILNRHYPEIKSVALAGRLKTACKEVLGLTEEQITDRVLKEAPLETPIYLSEDKLEALYAAFGEAANVDYDKHIRPHIGMSLDSPRRALQYVGTEVLRSIRDNIHSFYLYSQIKDTDGVYFVTDMRFFDEYEFLLEKFGENFEAWYIHSRKAEAAGAGDLHPSEMGIFKIKPHCLKLDNNGTLMDFENLLLELYSK